MSTLTSRKISLIILGSGIILSVILRILIIFNGLHIADIKLLYGMGEAMLKGANPYLVLDYNIYPPLGIYIQSFTIWLSSLLHLPFHILAKIWPNLADVIITITLYKILIRLKTNAIPASLWSLLYILNPISIIISSAHGQIDSICSMFTLISIYLLFFYSKKTHKFFKSPIFWSALVLGVAIDIKPNPAILLPIFLSYGKSIREKVLFLITAISPLIITAVYYILQNPYKIITNLLGYSGVYDFGYAAVLRGILYQDNASYWLPLTQEILSASKVTFLAGTIFLIIIYYKSKKLIQACLSIYLLFLGIYFGISAQYLSWILPLALIMKEKMTIIFSLSGFIALIGFYMFFGPDILLGKLLTVTAFQSKYMLIYVVGNLLLLATTFFWILKINFTHFSLTFNTLNNFQKKITIVSLIVFTISIIPTLQLVSAILNHRPR